MLKKFNSWKLINYDIDIKKKNIKLIFYFLKNIYIKIAIFAILFNWKNIYNKLKN